MAVVVNPYIAFACRADRNRILYPNLALSSHIDKILLLMQFLSLIRDITHETQSNELKCLAYCWTTPVDEDPSPDSPVLLQGLEVYATEDALTITHRSGTAYKHMREVVAATSLLPYPKGGVPTYVPAGSGFLGKARGKSEESETVSAEDYFVVAQYTTPTEDTVARATLLNGEQLLARELEAVEGVLAVWCFVPGSLEKDEVPIRIFIRLAGRDSFRGVEERMRKFEADVSKLGVRRTRFWEGQGFGFFRQVNYT